MKWYLAKLIYNIICGEGNHTPQFDEQVRLIYAEDDLHAFQKARTTGHREEDLFYNNDKKLVHWKFIDILELHPLEEFSDGAEIYSRIIEQYDAGAYIKHIYTRSALLQQDCNEKAFVTN